MIIFQVKINDRLDHKANISMDWYNNDLGDKRENDSVQ